MLFEQTHSEVVISNERAKGISDAFGHCGRSATEGALPFCGRPPHNHLESYEDYGRD